MRIFLLSISLTLALGLNAQDNTRGTDSSAGSGLKVIAVPFEAKMLLSDVNRKIGNQYGMTLDQIRDMMRTECGLALKRATCNSVNVTFLSPSHKDEAAEMTALFAAGRYKQETMRGREAKEPEFEKTTLADGEIKTMVEYGHKYMGLAVSDSTVWSDLRSGRGCERILIVTQMDIKNTVQPESADPATGYLLRWHFELYDAQNNKISGGAVSRWMPNDPAVDFLDNIKARMRDLAESVWQTTGLCATP